MANSDRRLRFTTADEIFARQVWGLAKRGDVLIAFTTSGNPETCARARRGETQGGESICFLGRDGRVYERRGTARVAGGGQGYRAHSGRAEILFHVLCESVMKSCPRLIDPAPNPHSAELAA